MVSQSKNHKKKKPYEDPQKGEQGNVEQRVAEGEVYPNENQDVANLQSQSLNQDPTPANQQTSNHLSPSEQQPDSPSMVESTSSPGPELSSEIEKTPEVTPPTKTPSPPQTNPPDIKGVGVHAIPLRSLRHIKTNVGTFERMLSVATGVALGLMGWGRHRAVKVGSVIMGGELIRRGLTGKCYGYHLLGMDRVISRQTPAVSERTVTILKPREELYQVWKDFEKAPLYMHLIQEVRVTGPNLTHWRALGPTGPMVEWDSEIIEDRAGEAIAWRVIHPENIFMKGKIQFTDAPSGKGTEVKVTLNYSIPGGQIGLLFAKMFGGDPDQQNKENLRHFKQWMETGEIPTAEIKTPKKKHVAA